MNSILLNKTKESFCNQVTKAMRYVADAYSPKESPYKIWTQYDVRQRSNLGFILAAHGNQVTIAMRYVADSYSPKEPP